jgi:hypothetical protein
MDLINSANMAAGRQFRDANPGLGLEATFQNAEWHNGVQNELVGIIEAGGLSPAAGVYNQVLQAMVNIVYPVGAYMNVEADGYNPNTLFSWQTWIEVKGAFLIGRDTAQAEFNATGGSGGAKTETLDIAHMPGHNHKNGIADDRVTAFPYGGTVTDMPGAATQNVDESDGGTTYQGLTSTEGGGEAFSILPPYRVVRMWKRTA